MNQYVSAKKSQKDARKAAKAKALGIAEANRQAADIKQALANAPRERAVEVPTWLFKRHETILAFTKRLGELLPHYRFAEDCLGMDMVFATHN